MRITILVSVLCGLSTFLYAQNTFPASGPVGIGTNAPSVSLEVFKAGSTEPIARFGNNTATNYHSIWVYNGTTSYNKVFICGSSGNFFNGTQQSDGGMQVTSGKGLFLGDASGNPTMIMKGGNVGIGYTSSTCATPVAKFQISDGGDDGIAYASAQIIRAANPGDNKFHLSFIRAGQMVSGIGYVNSTNTLGIWGGINTLATPTISFTQGGKVGIGTADPLTFKLAVDPQGAGAMVIGNPNTSGGNYTQVITGISAQTDGYGYIQAIRKSGSLYGVMAINPDGGNVLIGKNSQVNTGYKLDVAGDARANKVVVNTTGADFVFDSSYKLKDLLEVETFIGTNKHLPEIESAAEMQKDGLDLGDNQTKLLQKIEELTLYLIEQKKEIEVLQKEVEQLKSHHKNDHL